MSIKKSIGFVAVRFKSAFDLQRIRTKMILAFIVPILFIILLGMISYKNSTATITDITRRSAVSAMTSGGEYISAVFEGIDALAFQIFADTNVQDYLKNDGTTSHSRDFALSQSVDQKLTLTSSANHEISSILLLGKDSKKIKSYNLYSISSQIDPEQIKHMPFYQTAVAADGDMAWIGKHEELDVVCGIDSMDYSVSAVRLVKDLSDSKDMGIIVFNLKPDFAENTLSKMQIGENEELHLVSPDGRDISNMASSSRADITSHVFYSHILSSSDTHGYTENIDYNGEKYLMTYSKVGDTGYTIIGLIPSKDLRAPADQIIHSTIGIVVLSVIIAFLVGIVMANGISRAIDTLMHTAGNAASGDLRIEPVIRRHDELGKLATSIKVMIDSMKHLIGRVISTSKNVMVSSSTVLTTSQQVSCISHEITNAVQEISQGAAVQAQNAEDGFEKMEVLAKKITAVTDIANTINSLTVDTTVKTDEGLDSVVDLGEKASQTTEISKEILTSIQDLGRHSKSIDRIVKVIKNITNQINLLALNAAIEAARAGEKGKGFTVVAQEVWKLAEQSMKSTHDITVIINDVQMQTEMTMKKAQKVEKILDKQNKAVSTTTEVFRDIRASMQSLLIQVEQIMSSIADMECNKEEAHCSMQNISTVSQETAASSEEIAASVQEQLSFIEKLATYAGTLNQSVHELDQLISWFKL